jgi:hypothetical protein
LAYRAFFAFFAVLSILTGIDSGSVSLRPAFAQGDAKKTQQSCTLYFLPSAASANAVHVMYHGAMAIIAPRTVGLDTEHIPQNTTVRMREEAVGGTPPETWIRIDVTGIRPPGAMLFVRASRCRIA